MRDVNPNAESAAEISGLTEVGEYSIQADGKMFRILIDGLYSDKPRAIIRELCTNAFDSHIEAGIPTRPFKIQLPTRFDDAFSVRDYGVSLTHDQVMHLYTTLGRSTKGDSNKSVGKFGLGCKTPFAYADSFTITAIKDGRKRIYNSFMDSGTPKIALLMDTESDEEQGLEVSFGVKANDAATFTAAAKRVLVGFDLIPINNIGVVNQPFEILFKGTGWRIVKKDYDIMMTQAYVRQGCVLYPIDRGALQAVRPSAGLDVLGDEAMIIDMPIGSVDITPSRESLSYDAVTVNNILARIDDIEQSVVSELTKAVKDAKTFYEAIKIRNSILTGVTSHKLQQVIRQQTKWKKRTLPNAIKVTERNLSYLRRHGVHLQTIDTGGRRGRNKRAATGSVHSLEILPSQDITVIYSAHGLQYQGYRLAAAGAQHNGYSKHTFFMNNFVPGGKQEMRLHVAFGRPSQGTIKFVNLEDFPFDKPTFERSKIMLGIYQGGTKFGKTTIAPDDETRPVFYVHTHAGVAQRNGRDTSTQGVFEMWKQLMKLKLLPDDAILVGIPKSRKDIASAIPEEWDDFFEAVHEIIAKNFDPEAAARANLALELRNEDNNSNWFSVMKAIEDHPENVEDDNSPIMIATREFAPYFEEGKAQGEFHLAMQKLIHVSYDRDIAQKMVKSFDVGPWKTSFAATMTAVRKAYPMLRDMIHIGSYYFNGVDQKNFLPHIVEYVNLKNADMIRQQKLAHRRAEDKKAA